MKCGYIALIGRPNAGKSTLLNALVENKLSAVSRLRQTTRHSIKGIFTEPPCQMIFIDTPGMHDDHQRKLMNHMMRQIVDQVSQEADVIVYLIDCAASWNGEDEVFLQNLAKRELGDRLVIFATKEDKIKKQAIQRNYEIIQEKVHQIFGKDKSVLLGSAKIPECVKGLRELFKELIPEGHWLFDEAALSDQSEKFLFAEIIQEQIFRQLGEEVPYQSRVVVEKVEHQPNICKIIATIFVSQESQKAILIGKGGSQIKSLGQKSREVFEKNLGEKVFLDLQVVVQKDWDRKIDIISSYLDGE